MVPGGLVGTKPRVIGLSEARSTLKGAGVVASGT